MPTANQTLQRPYRKIRPLYLKLRACLASSAHEGLKSSLEKLDGISIHEIDPKEGFAKLSFKQTHMPSDEILKETVENAGFKLTKVQRKKENDSDQDS